MPNLRSVKFKIKFINGATYNDFELTTCLNSISDLDIASIIRQDTFAIVTATNHLELQPFLKQENHRKLQEIGLQIDEDAQLKSLRTIYSPGIQNYIASSNPEFLIEQIHDFNSNLEVEELYFLGSSTNPLAPKNNLKIVFTKSEMAQQCIENGLKIGCVNINADRIQLDEYIAITQCFKCMKLGHIAANCSDIQICSKCSGEHSYKLCPVNNEDNLKCALCSGKHIAVSNTCPKRKAFAQSLRKQKTEDNNSNSNNQYTSAPPPASNPWSQNKHYDTSNTSTNFPNLSQPRHNQWTAEVLQNASQQHAMNEQVPTQQSHQNAPASNTDSQSKVDMSNHIVNSLENAINKIENLIKEHNIIQKQKQNNDLRYRAFDTFAKMASEGEPLKYLALMNEFFIESDIEELPTTETLIRLANCNLVINNDDKTNSFQTETTSTQVNIQETVVSQVENSPTNSSASVNSSRPYSTISSPLDSNNEVDILGIEEFPENSSLSEEQLETSDSQYKASQTSTKEIQNDTVQEFSQVENSQEPVISHTPVDTDAEELNDNSSQPTWPPPAQPGQHSSKQQRSTRQNSSTNAAANLETPSIKRKTKHRSR